RVLATLAHLAVDLAARLSLQAARRQPARPAQNVPKPDRDDAAGWHLAWRRLEIRHVGRDARRGVGGRAHARTDNWPTSDDTCGQARRDADRVPLRLLGLDLLPGRGFRGRANFHRQNRLRLEPRGSAGRAVCRWPDRTGDGAAISTRGLV